MMEPHKAPVVLNLLDIMPIVKSPNNVPDVMPENAMPILNTPPKCSTTNTRTKQMQPIENVRIFIVLLACFSVAFGK